MTNASPLLANKRLIIVGILGFLAALGPFSIDMYLPAFPAISTSLGSPIADVQLSLASFFIGISAGQLLYGPLTDRFGRKKPLYIGLALYLLASAGCMASGSVSILIGMRLLQALGGCAGMVVSRAVVRDLFPPSESAKVYSMLMLVMGVAPIIAPSIGSYVVAYAGWRYIFLILVVIAAVNLTAVYLWLPESKKADDTVSLRIPHIAAGYWEVLKNPVFYTYAISGGLATAGMFAYISGSPFVYMELFGFSETQYGWLFGMNAMGLIAASQVNRFIVNRFGSAQIVRLIGFIVMLAGICLSLSGFFMVDKHIVLPLVFVFVASLGFIMPNTTALTLHPFARNAGTASALMGALQMVIAALASSAVSLFDNKTMQPMVIVMTVCSSMAYILLTKGTQKINAAA